MPVIAATVRRRLAREDGYSLPELLIGITVGLIVLFAGLATLDHAAKNSRNTTLRVDAAQRGRLAMDQIVRELRSQVCLGPLSPALIAGTGSSVTFYADLSDGSRPPERRVLTFDSGTARISEQTFVGTGAAPNTTYSSSPTRTRILLENAFPVGTTPVFRYWAYDTVDPPSPTVGLPVPLSSNDLLRAAVIEIAFMTKPIGKNPKASLSSSLHDQILVRSTDPQDPQPTPVCA